MLPTCRIGNAGKGDYCNSTKSRCSIRANDLLEFGKPGNRTKAAYHALDPPTFLLLSDSVGHSRILWMTSIQGRIMTGAMEPEYEPSLGPARHRQLSRPFLGSTHGGLSYTGGTWPASPQTLRPEVNFHGIFPRELCVSLPFSVPALSARIQPNGTAPPIYPVSSQKPAPGAKPRLETSQLTTPRGT